MIDQSMDGNFLSVSLADPANAETMTFRFSGNPRQWSVDFM